jgi:hypothetical protein
MSRRLAQDLSWTAQGWFLQSTADQDTHRGTLQDDGTVVVKCGIQFRPRPLPMGRLSLPGSPQDPDQICPKCYAAKKKAVRST